MPKRKQMDLSTRELIIKLYTEGNSMRKIGQILSRTHSSVQKVINKFRYDGTLQNKKGRGRKKIFSQNDERYIVRKMTADPKSSVPKLTEHMSQMINRKVSTETVRRVLHNNDIHGRIARKKPYISKQNQQKRLKFALDHVNMPISFWNKVMFTDETKINLFGTDGKQIVWRKPNTEVKKNNLVHTVKHGGGCVMLWGSMAANGAGTMEFIDTIMNKDAYLNILKRQLPLSALKLGLSSDYYFQQDNDPKHTAHIVREWLLYNTPKRLQTPPQSPDINPIEHLWGYVKNKLKKYEVSNVNDLKKQITGIWNEIPATFTQKLVESMPRRLQAVIDAKGGATKY